MTDDSIMAYPVYWTMSLNDYFWESGDRSVFDRLLPDARRVLDDAARPEGWHVRQLWRGVQGSGDDACELLGPCRAPVGFGTEVLFAHEPSR